jgi:hypothetical protein
MALNRLTDKSTEELLELILVHMQNMDRRDHWRTIGGFFRGLLSIVPVLIFFASTWYIYAYRDTLMENMSKQVMETMTKVMPAPSSVMDGDVMKRLQQLMESEPRQQE